MRTRMFQLNDHIKHPLPITKIVHKTKIYIFKKKKAIQFPQFSQQPKIKHIIDKRDIINITMYLR